MTTRERILAAALDLLEEGGTEQFSTRAVCARASVTAPTLYHHYGSADGLLSAAMAEVSRQFLASKRAAVQSSDPRMALREGWDDYVRFASLRPRLFATTMSRLLDGAQIEAAVQGRAELRRIVETIAAEGHLAVSVEAGVDLAWASANAAALLYVSSLTGRMAPPDEPTITALRESAIAMICADSTG